MMQVPRIVTSSSLQDFQVHIRSLENSKTILMYLFRIIFRYEESSRLVPTIFKIAFFKETLGKKYFKGTV